MPHKNLIKYTCHFTIGLSDKGKPIFYCLSLSDKQFFYFKGGVEMPKADTRNKIGDNTICVGVYVPKITHAQLVAIAKDKQLTLSDIIRAAIREYINKEKGRKE